MTPIEIFDKAYKRLTELYVYFKQACELLWYKTNYPDDFYKVMKGEDNEKNRNLEES